MPRRRKQTTRFWTIPNGGLFLGVAGFAHADRFATLSLHSYGWGAFYIVPPARTLPVQFAVGTADGFAASVADTMGFLQGQGHEVRLITAPGVGHRFSGVSVSAPADVVTDWMLSRPL